MFAAFVVAFVAFLASASAQTILYSGAYCGPESSLVTQAGSYATPAACSTQCSAYSYFSYVVGSGQCLCTNTCSSSVPNGGVNSYVINPTPTFAPTPQPPCYPGAYCGPEASLATQAGTYATPAACGAQCASASSSYHFYSYVPGTQQCLCATSCGVAQQVVNPNVNSYCMNPSYSLCWTGEYCSNVVTQGGIFSTPQACADLCSGAGKGYTFMSYVPGSSQCECSVGCSGPVANPNVNTYGLNGQSCNTNRLRHV